MSGRGHAEAKSDARRVTCPDSERAINEWEHSMFNIISKGLVVAVFESEELLIQLKAIVGVQNQSGWRHGLGFYVGRR
jgi:hypothetical protein